MSDIVVWAADIGSIRAGNFGWCRTKREGEDLVRESGTDIASLAGGIARDLSDSLCVALGFECPLFVPVTKDPLLLTMGRGGESNRPWSAGAGAAALAIGLTECAWIFEQLLRLSQTPITPTFDWARLASRKANLFIWEAFVSKESKGQEHEDDAEIAIRSFWENYPGITEANAVTAENPFSLVGAALLRAGITTDLAFLSTPCIVIRS